MQHFPCVKGRSHRTGSCAPSELCSFLFYVHMLQMDIFGRCITVSIAPHQHIGFLKVKRVIPAAIASPARNEKEGKKK